jgi:hypothetical protein
VAVDKDQWLKREIGRKKERQIKTRIGTSSKGQDAMVRCSSKNESLTAKTNAHIRAEKYCSIHKKNKMKRNESGTKTTNVGRLTGRTNAANFVHQSLGERARALCTLASLSVFFVQTLPFGTKVAGSANGRVKRS